MASDAKLARNAADAITRAAVAIHRTAATRGNSGAARQLGAVCSIAIGAVKGAAAQMSVRHRQHAALLVRPITTACTSVSLAAAAATDEARAHLFNQAQAAIALALEGVQALQSEIAPINAQGAAMNGLDFLGADDGGSTDSGGFVSSLFKTVGGLATGAVNYVKGEKAKNDAAADADSKLQAAISADSTATLAVTQALLSADAASRDPAKADSALADKMMADSAVAAQDKAGAAVSASSQQKRIDAAQKAVDGAQSRLSAALKGSSAPAKIAAKFAVQAAQQTLSKAQGGGIVKQDKGGGEIAQGGSGSSSGALAFFTKKLGPLPRYGYVLLAAGGYAGYRFFTRKRA